MKHIRVASDLHLEAFSGRNAETLAIDFLPADERDAESILVLAGDISSDPNQLLAFLNACCKRFPKVYYVAGNHEWYRHDYVHYTKELQLAIHNHQTVHGALTNLEYALDEVCYEELEDLKLRFIFAPLWADGGPTLGDRGQVGFYLNDFRLITMPGHGDPNYRQIPRKFSVDDMIAIHKRQKAGIEEYLKQPFDGRTVVITHHLPSRRLVSARFWPGNGSDGANGGFASDCDNMIAVNEPWLWIHGHTHDTIDTKLWETRIVCNPAGYRGEWATPHNEFMQPPFDPANPTVKPHAVGKFVDL
jgi:hypothetical protein